MLKHLLVLYFFGFQLFCLFHALISTSSTKNLSYTSTEADVCLSLGGILLFLWILNSTRCRNILLFFSFSTTMYCCFKICGGRILLSSIIFTPMMMMLWLNVAVWGHDTPKRWKVEFVPAMSFPFLTKLYDPIVAWTCREDTFKKALMKQAALESKKDVLDVGCGTGTLILHLKHAFPELHVVGVDADQTILDIAQKKADRESMKLELHKALGENLPFDAESFDVAVSSLFFHHLHNRDKLDTFKSVYKVLRSGGELHVADWGKPTNGLMRLLFLFVQVLDGFETTQDNVDGILPDLMQKAGFEDIHTCRTFSTVFGTLSLYSAKKNPK